MSEWWTYRLSDFLMFSPGTWYRLLELHNARWWPLHGVWLAAGLLVMWALGRPAPRLTKWTFVVTGSACLFTAWAFLWRSYADINWAATYAAVAFAAHGVGLLGMAVRVELRPASGGVLRVGQALVAAALLYPALAVLFGRPWAQSELFALMPDPTALATLGLLLCARRAGKDLAWGWFGVPLMWCGLSGATLFSLNAPEWWVLPSLGLLALGARWRAARR